MRTSIAVLFGLVLAFDAAAVKLQPSGRKPPSDPAVAQRLEWFRDQKLGFFVHFGIYSQIGGEASWVLVDKTPQWRKAVNWTDGDGDAFKRDYFALNRSFNPVAFRPDCWAKLAKESGFRYFILTAKHHDGFCLWDTKLTDYKVTAPDCPFSKNPRADILRQAFDAFRAEGLGISCYFSKPDFHHPDYWDNLGLGRQTAIYPSYDVNKEPERWKRYCEFAHAQVMEIVRGYGKIDVLWLDSVSNIDAPELSRKVREVQPGMLVVNRYDRGVCEDFVTPEQQVPKNALSAPWESCMTMIDDPKGGGWGYLYDADYKSERTLVHLLVDVVAKGGNLALDVGPTPSGALPPPAVTRMNAMGRWLQANGAAIYGTRILAPYRTENWAYAKGKDGTAYAIRLWKDGEDRTFELTMDEKIPTVPTKAVHLSSGREVAVRTESDGRLTLVLPKDVKLDEYADAFRLVTLRNNSARERSKD